MTHDDDEAANAVAGTQRLDKWLWFVRLVKTRSLAQKLIEAGGVRVNRVKVEKPSYSLKVGDVITASLDRRVRVLRMVAAGARRGPPADAQTLYEDLTPPPDMHVQGDGPMAPHPMSAAGRPSKQQRRTLQRLKRSPR